MTAPQANLFRRWAAILAMAAPLACGTTAPAGRTPPAGSAGPAIPTVKPSLSPRLDLSTDPVLQAYLAQLPRKPDLTRFEVAEVDDANEVAKYREGVTAVYENLLRDIEGKKDRDTHRKTHGCTRAELSVAGNLSAKYQRGVFIAGKTYPVWLRFANGKGVVEHDKEDDTRSISMKLMAVGSQPRHQTAHEQFTQDFLLQNSAVFFVQTMERYISLLNVARDTPDKNEAKTAGLVAWMLRHPYERETLQYTTRRKPASLVTEQYWSGASYLFGAKGELHSRPVRYALKPCQPQQVEQLADTSALDNDENYYRNELARRLETGAQCYRFGIQELPDLSQVDLSQHKQPIAYIGTEGNDNKVKHLVEDATINWDDYAPHIEWVATLTIFKQRFKNSALDQHCGHMGFSPYNGVVAHRPLGTLNRLRGHVYPIVRNYRRPTEPKPYPEPSATDELYRLGRID